MNISEVAYIIWAAQRLGIIKSRADFHKTYKTIEDVLRILGNHSGVMSLVQTLKDNASWNDRMDGAVCFFDREFPVINANVKANGDKPYLLFYKGNLSLLHDLNQNVAVIGHTSPNETIEKRERNIVSQLVKNGMVIVSGLAKGCDTISHDECMKQDGQAIAILPSPLYSVLPKEHVKVAHHIVESGGLLVSEYDEDPKQARFEQSKRYIDRDRLQAMFAKVVVLIASYAEGEGDSGARHAMQKAEKYGHVTCVMYHESQDSHKVDMKLNRQLAESGTSKIIVQTNESNNRGYMTIEDIVTLRNPHLVAVVDEKVQDSLF
ncbi:MULTISPECIES: DNA-processing protein DprA [unclassified Veillonella]|uniref:DNA-processing protein DprA n=1 Tax=unclassified Veillonella TaxID=2630086 RepID=UPI000F8F2A86|nr:MULTISPECIES: DNA-processing protein DprA [unclassified Veillonella]